MTKKRILFLFLVLSTAAQAQLKDSLWVKQNSFYNDIQTRLFETPLLFTSQALGDFTQVQIDFEQKALPFKRVQTAEKVSKYAFSTQGIFNIKPRLRLFGDFNYNQTFEDGLGYNLSTERTENQNVLAPNYFLVPKKGNWESQHYRLNGGVSYQLENNILLGATVNYRNSQSYRQIDPRPEIIVSDYGAVLHAGYVYQNHRVFASVGMGRKNETTDIVYVDKDLSAPAFPNTFTTFSSGYGRTLFNPTYNKYIFKTIDKNFGVGYQFQNERNSVGITYKFNKAMQDLYSKDVEGNIYLEDALIQYRYRNLSHITRLNFYHDGDLHDYKAQLELNSNQGDNFSVVENGQNFRSNVDRLQLTTGVIRKEEGKVAYDFEFNVGITKHKYIDLLGSIDKRLKTLEMEVIFNRDVFRNQANKINLEVGLKHYKALTEKLDFVPTSSSTDFVDNVVFLDHAFDSTSKLRSNAELNYYIRLPKKRNLQLFVNYQTLVALDKQYLKYAPNLQTKFSNYFNIGLAVNY